jgi:hypothetical protein
VDQEERQIMLGENIRPAATGRSVPDKVSHRPEQDIVGVAATAASKGFDLRANTLSSREREFGGLDLAAAVKGHVKAILGKIDMSQADGDIPNAIQPALAKPMTADCVYNLFRNRQRPELLCAVPEDRPVPGFVVAKRWSVLLRPLRPMDVAPPGFHLRAACAGVRFNGFYLFQVTGRDGTIAPNATTRHV